MRKHMHAEIRPALEAPSTSWRDAASAALTRISVVLRRAARALRAQSRNPAVHRPSELEFYAEAGAPEGALYLDGELVGYLSGINRL